MLRTKDGRPDLRIVGDEPAPTKVRRSLRQWARLSLAALVLSLPVWWAFVPSSHELITMIGVIVVLYLWAKGAWMRKVEEDKIPIIGRVIHTTRRW